MEYIGKSLAGNSMIPDRTKSKMPPKYITPFSEFVGGIVRATQNGELSSRDWDNAVIKIAHERLNIKECPACKYPFVDGWCCTNCGRGSETS